MTEEQKKYIKELRDKMLAENASNDEIKFAINNYLYKESLKAGEQESTPTAMDSTLTGDTEADIVATGANVANPDYWENVDSDPRDWVETADGGYRNTVTGEIMVAGSVESAMWDDDQMALYEQLELNNALYKSIVEGNEKDDDQQSIDMYWNDHSSDMLDIDQLDVRNKSDYEVISNGFDENGKETFQVWHKGDQEFKTVDDPEHGEAVSMLLKENEISNSEANKKKKEGFRMNNRPKDKMNI